MLRDGSFLRQPFGGTPGITAARHDGSIRADGTRAYRDWGWMPGKSGPAFTYQTLADECKARFRLSGLNDRFAFEDSWNIAVTRYSLHQKQIRHNAANFHRGEEIQA